MPLPLIADTARAVAEWTLPNGRQGANIWHIRKTSALTWSVAADTFASAMTTWINVAAPGATTALKTHLSNGCRFERLRFTVLDGVTASFTRTIGISGVDASAPLPVNVALVITLRTALRGRRNRGRIYIAGFAEDQNAAGGVPVAGIPNNFALATRNLISSLGGSGVSVVVASYGVSMPTVKRPTKLTWTPYATDVTTADCDTRWDTQRRRLS